MGCSVKDLHNLVLLVGVGADGIFRASLLYSSIFSIYKRFEGRCLCFGLLSRLRSDFRRGNPGGMLKLETIRSMARGVFREACHLERFISRKFHETPQGTKTIAQNIRNLVGIAELRSPYTVHPRRTRIDDLRCAGAKQHRCKHMREMCLSVASTTRDAPIIFLYLQVGLSTYCGHRDALTKLVPNYLSK